ncbi:MAG TPA: sigma-54 dependent transcriptional regulator [Gemmatimonadales bacterium]|jgi:two-component system response regulator HydG|nr:sigma-54 dependent transcriptional regulator [Gemmatimonadales bacterium]
MADTLLLVDDDPAVLRAIGDYFEKIGYEVWREATGDQGIETFHRVRPDAVILDLHLPDASGLVVLERLRRDNGAVILLTGQGDIETAVRAMQLGAENFLTKPVDMTHLAAATARVVEKVRLSHQNALLRARDHEGEGLSTLGVSPAMRDFSRQVELLAASERSTVLLQGESGTGKGWVARVIHNLSPRAQGPFVEVNCGGLSATFLDSEMFGHERGAYTDAKERKLGLFEVADRGTILLDEIGELAPELQPKLLKVLETKKFRRLGGTRELSVDVRLVAATNRDLVAEVESGRFREDLYYRLNVMPLTLPPVRERAREDRLALLTRILEDLKPQLAGCPAECSSEALDRLLSAPWPGNVREMRNVLERAMILSRGRPAIGVEHLPADLRQRAAGGGGGGDRRHQPQSLSDVERQHIERTLRQHGGNRTRAAQELGISRATLINKIKVYSLNL